MSMLTMLVCFPLLQAQSRPPQVTLGEPQKVVGKRNATFETKIPVSILDGYHINSDIPTDESQIPLKVTWTSLGALEGGRMTFPKAGKITVGDHTLSVFTGKINLTAKFKVSAKAPAGPGIASGKLFYQACDDSKCYPPKSVEFNVAYQVQ